MMKLDFKNIHLGTLIKAHIQAEEISTERICSFMKCTEQELEDMLKQKDFSTDILLRLSKLLEYDLFRLYSQHLSLYAPQKGTKSTSHSKNTLPLFRKNLYTKEIIDFILDLVNSGKKSKKEIIEEYNIPKTTLYKWIAKY